MDMWIDKDNWDYWKYNNAFVGKSEKTLVDLFPGNELTNIPPTLHYTATIKNEMSFTAQTVNHKTQTRQTLIWELETTGEWFTVTQSSGSTPEDSFTIVPVTTTLETLPAGSYSGTVTVTVTAPAETVNAKQRIDLTLSVARPTLAPLPDTLTFTYYRSDSTLIPTQQELIAQNSGSEDVLSWTVTHTGSWYTVNPLSGTTPGSFIVAPASFSTTDELTYTGALTLAVTDPPDTDKSPQQMTVMLHVTAAEMPKIFLPLILRNYTAPVPLNRPNDSYYNSQWALEKINAPAAWSYSQGDGVLIAVLDTGVDFDHADLTSKLRSDIDRDYINDDNEAQDDAGHGTHVAGIAAAATNNARVWRDWDGIP